MSAQSKTALNSTIDAQITTNGSNDITGAQLNAILGDMVDSYEDFVGSYTTAQIAALTGMTLRQRVFNTTDNDYEYYDGTRWVKEAHPKYKLYEALLTQGSGDPSIVVYENNIGATITMAKTDVGEFLITASVAAFTANKTVVKMGNPSDTATSYWYAYGTTTTLQLTTEQESAGTFAATDGLLSNTLIQIIVYY